MRAAASSASRARLSEPAPPLVHVLGSGPMARHALFRAALCVALVATAAAAHARLDMPPRRVLAWMMDMKDHSQGDCTQHELDRQLGELRLRSRLRQVTDFSLAVYGAGVNGTIVNSTCGALIESGVPAICRLRTCRSSH